jgi:two-component system NtrC family sensor kinase
VKDVRTLNLWQPDAFAGVRRAVWASVVPPLVFFVLAVALSLGATTPFSGSLSVFVIAAFAASAAAASWVSVRLVQQLRAIVRQRDAFYQEFARLSKLASLGEAACSIAHDLNNPLAIMNEEAGWLQDLLASTDTDAQIIRHEVTSSVEQLQIQIGRCRGIARRMLTWTRGSDTASGQVDLNTLLTKTLYLVETELVATGVRVEKRLAAGLPPVAGSVAELRQVLLHLMKNALDAMKGTGGTLTITTARVDDAVRATVADSGHGMPPELLARIFEPFFTTKGEELGTGLGLTIGMWIVQRIGGRLDAESTPGVGSAFHVTLPIAGTPAETRTPHERREAAAGR